MSNLTPFLDRNRSFAGTSSHQGLSPMPSHQLMVITCMDGRVDPAHVLGVELGEALVIRNSGGRITKDVLAEIAFVGEVTSMMFGDDAQPFEVAVIHHTACGTGLLADPDLRRAIADRSGVGEEHLEGQAVTDPFESVRVDVDHLRSWAGLPERAAVSGHVYDVESGVVSLVVDTARAEASGSA